MKKLIAFFEIPATDFRRAVDFYETVLGVQLPTFECETEKMACFTEEGETVGAISYTSNFDFLPSTHGVLIHFNCEDIEQTLEKVLLKGLGVSSPIMSALLPRNLFVLSVCNGRYPCCNRMLRFLLYKWLMNVAFPISLT